MSVDDDELYIKAWAPFRSSNPVPNNDQCSCHRATTSFSTVVTFGDPPSDAFASSGRRSSIRRVTSSDSLSTRVDSFESGLPGPVPVKVIDCGELPALSVLTRFDGGGLEQIKFLLGHSSISTTERYLGSQQEIATAVNDR